jgi:Chalcone isomerase-like
MKMKIKIMIVSLFCVLASNAQALEIKGVKVEETAQVADSALVLNGAGMRVKLMFKVYVAGLYLTQKLSDASAVINDMGNKRISMHFLRNVEAEALLGGMNEGFTDNNTKAEMVAIEPQMKAFRQMMTSAKEVKQGDEIVLDLTSAGTQVNLNGKLLGHIDGEAFNRALLRVWLGNKPVDALLKKALLGN